MKAILILISIILINGCGSIPLMDEPIVRCGIRVEKVDVNLYKGKCRCHIYEITPENIGRISESINYPLEHCNNSVVLRPVESWTPLRAWWEELMFVYNQNKKKIKRKFKDRKRPKSFIGSIESIGPIYQPIDVESFQ